MGNNNCCCRGHPKYIEGSTQTLETNNLNMFHFENTTNSISTNDQNLCLSDRKNNELGVIEENGKHRRMKSDLPTKNEVPNSNDASVIKATKNGFLGVPLIKHQKTNSVTTSALTTVETDEKTKKINENSESTHSENPEKQEKPKKKLAFKDEADEKERNDKKIEENTDKTKKKITFQENTQVILGDNMEESPERGRSRTNCGGNKKSGTDFSEIDLNSLVRSKSLDTGKKYLESQCQEIDDMFGALFNFHSLKLKKVKNSISQDKNDIISPLNDENDFDTDSSGSENNSENDENKEEMDLIEICDVETFVSRRLSKTQLEKNETNYEVSPKMKRLLGKFYNEPSIHAKNSDAQNKITLFSDAMEKNIDNIDNCDNNLSVEAKKIKSLAKNNSILKKQMQKIKPQPKMARRNSERDIAKKLEDNKKIKKLLEELHLFNRYGSNFTVKVSNGKPLIKTGGGFITLEDYLQRVLNKLAKKNKKNQSPKIQLDSDIIQKLSDYLVNMAENKNEVEAKNPGGKFVTARVQRRPTGWTVKKPNMKESPMKNPNKKSEDLQIDEKISVQVVSPIRNFKF